MAAACVVVPGACASGCVTRSAVPSCSTHRWFIFAELLSGTTGQVPRRRPWYVWWVL